MNRRILALGCLVVAAAALPARAAAQAPAGLTLDAMHKAAAAADPRVQQLELEAAQTELRLRMIDTDRLPQLGLTGRAQHQSDVPSAPVFAPPKNTADAYVSVEQRLFDASMAARAEAARAELGEARARIATALFAVRAEVNEAFFAVLDAGARLKALDTRIAALEALRRVADARLTEGAALPSEPRAIEATLLERRRDRESIDRRREAALARLSAAAGIEIPPSATLTLPALAPAVAGIRERHADLRARPEFAQFDRARDRLAAEAQGIDAARQPRVSAFGRAGYGRPGLNFIADRWDTYWLAGLQLQWSPVTWGKSAREREVLDIEREIIAADEAAFARRLARTAAAELADIDRLEAMLALDAEIVALREAVERETRIRWDARVITLAEYLDRSGELLDAELALAARRVELAAARARFLTTAGLEVR